ncbi:hypothetical protein EG328_004756 [Venturia inaequalis]|uniref:Uncharacterized protein n=1 Tax=Venturia inaequalis TaxID=5025 RepID=A0A8H3YXR0_VENIN|nr:hypothetical protein EG328_004756 [Venturia inaequalis]
MPAFQRTSRDAARHESGFLRSTDEVKDGEKFVSCRKTDELSGAKKFGKFQELEGKPEHFPGAVTVRAFGGLEVVLRIVKDVALKKRRDALPEIDTPRLFVELAQPFTGKAKIAGGDETVKCEV